MTTEQFSIKYTSQNNVGETFPARLKSLRETQQLDRKTLAELCGLSKNMIGQYERGEREPTIKTLTVIADYFDVSLDYLTGRK